MKKAFTLLELILVMGILLLMTGLSAVFYSRFLLENAVDNTVAQITEDLRKAQMYSMSSKANSAWGVKFSNSTLTLYQAGGTRSENFSINPNIIVTGLDDIQFARVSGYPATNALITVAANSINTSRTITVSSIGVASK